ncbi:tyrosine phosphatase family-domain-containing protein [Lipomyces oligophaga]|uniref:tyrosine phosphatase family-domain-containing protein n=1 Tax=Lipomyces oligophaga TaxID=45792 RepID=UPI0034CDD79E
MLAPPELFGIVEEDIYRCTEIDPLNFPFLQTLSLKTILFISQLKPSPAVELFARENQIEIAHMKLPSWTSDEEWKLLPDNIASSCLSYVLNTQHYPILIIDLSCTFIGVLRKVQHWALSSIINEYREMSFDRAQYLYELYLELVDLSLIHVPRISLSDRPVSSSASLKNKSYQGKSIVLESDQNSSSSFDIEHLPDWYIEYECMWYYDKMNSIHADES